MALSTLIRAVIITGHLAAVSAFPSVTLDKGAFVGASDGTTDKFLGIPYALPPIGDRRFNSPVLNVPYLGEHTATDFGPWCPQQKLTPPPLPPSLDPNFMAKIVATVLGTGTPLESEDCLTLNVWRPSGVSGGAALPVVVWIHGGGFETGGSAPYDGGVIVRRSIELGEPILYVSINYRLSIFGFLSGKEVKDAGQGNLGLRDQRLALRWIQKYIHEFGGDPSKVTIWGESAGAISVASHMVTNGGNTEGLFRGAFMHSGSLYPSGDIASAQTYYDDIVAHVGCNNTSGPTLECLRHASYNQLKDAMNASPDFFSAQSLSLTWAPRVDSNFLLDTPRNLASAGKIADIPFVIGTCYDEGTMFALSSLNITTEDELREYLVKYFFVNASPADLDRLLETYSADPTFGAPYDSGNLNAVTPQFKRIASILGDLLFDGPKRLLLQRAEKQKAWAFVSKRHQDAAILGATHVTDLLNIFGPGDLTDYLIHFVNHLDPNGLNPLQLNLDFDWTQSLSDLKWPQYNLETKQMLTFVDGPVPQVITRDSFRQEEIDVMNEFASANPLR